MTRLGKKPIAIPEGTEVAVADGAVSVTGKKGTLTRQLHRDVSVTVDGGEVQVAPVNDSNRAYALWGTFASHLRNMVEGVNEPFCKTLVVEGVGYRVEVAGETLKLIVGFSHPIEIAIPKELDVSVEKNEITICGIDKEQVGQFAADVRSRKTPEPYKGKGIRYKDEIVRRKQGKKSA